MLPGVLWAARLVQARRAGRAFDPAEMVLSDFATRARLAWVALSGRW